MERLHKRKNDLVIRLDKMQLNGQVQDNVFSQVINKLSNYLPQDYLLFLKENNGGKGFIANNYLTLWKLEDLTRINEDYGTDEFAPELFLIGSDGGDIAYGTIKNTTNYVEVPFIGLSLEESKIIGKNLNEFFDYLSK